MKTTNVAITGISRAGKTNFLTSLLWHIDQLCPAFTLKNAAKKNITIAAPKIKEPAQHCFAFLEKRADFINQKKFVGKTTDRAECSVTFSRSDWKFDQKIKFFDFPGERITDIAMMGGCSYEQWCDNVFAALRTDPGACNAVQSYCQSITNASVDDCIRAYKEMHADLLSSYNVLVSPSTLLIDGNGKESRTKINGNNGNFKTQFVRTSISGLPNGEFVPLPKEILPDKKQLAAVFRKRYNVYQSSVVKELTGKLLSSEVLLILTSIPDVLMHGGLYLNNVQQIIEHLADVVNPQGKLFGKLLCYAAGLPMFGYKHYPLKKVAFIATQTDRILPADIHSGHLDMLHAALIHKANAALTAKKSGVKCEQFSCASVKGTQFDTAIGALQCYINFDPQGKPVWGNFKPSDLPAKFPTVFSAYVPGNPQPDTFNFPLPPRPLVIPNTNLNPPEQDGLGEILEFIIN